MSGDEFVHNDAAFVAFGHGQMNCIGRALALLELRTVLCAIVQRFYVSAWPGWDRREYEAEMRDFVTLTRPRLPVKLEKR